MELDDPIFNALHMYTKALSVALGYRDLLTRLHSDRVQGLSVEIGVRYGLSNNEINALTIAASFHDIGKIGIPDHILRKPARLDEAEWKTMKQHSEIGEKIMAATELEGALQASILIRHHHEHYNGMGYPDGLAGENIPICSRIIAIADSYDAMAVTRAYHNARTHQEIIGILDKESGAKHDPNLMHIFYAVIETSVYKAAKA
ncbi:MAG: HD domain-containing protein [Sideroxyarcus sp.]|nr:HD domain-containing protein [Sideroxyarcus sp.]